MKMFKWAVRILLYPTLIFFIISLIFFYLYSTPKKKTTPVTPSQFGLKYEEVSAKTEDGINLSFWFIPNNNSKKGIIMLHGWPADKGDIITNTFFLSKNYNLLYLDFRAMGKSEGKFSTGGYLETRDIKTAVGFLKTKGINDISLYGYSMGAFTAVIYSILNDDIKSVVADSPYDSIHSVLKDFFKFYGFLSAPILWFINLEYKIIYGKFITDLSLSKNIDKIDKPILILCGNKDDVCYNDKLNHYPGRNKNVEVLILDGFSHNESIYYKNYEKILSDFYDKKFI